MTNGFVLVSDMAAGGVRVTVCLFFLSYLLSVKRPEKKSVAAAVAGAAAVALLTLPAGMPDSYRMALEAVWIAVCAGRFQRADVRMSLFVGIFYEIAVSFWQFLAAAWLGVWFRSAAFLAYGSGSGQTAVWLVHSLLIAAMLYVSVRQPGTGKETFRFVSGMTAAGLLAVVTLSEQTVLVIADDTLYMWTILAVVLMMAVLVFNMSRQYEVEKEFAKLKSEQAELLERDYSALSQAYEMHARLFHDFHNHIGALRQLLLHNKTKEAMQYLDELQAPVQKMADTVWTGDETVDYLINSKAVLAGADEIEYKVQVEFPRHMNLRSADLCAILGNLLDNALEAARQTPKPGHRFVYLTIRRIHKMLVIKVENSFKVLPVEEGGGLKTTKEEKGLHGWGLKSARAAAEKYDGMVQTSYTESTFRAVVTLSYEGITIESGIHQ